MNKTETELVRNKLYLYRESGYEYFRRILNITPMAGDILVEFEETSRSFDYPEKFTLPLNKFLNGHKRIMEFAVDPDSIKKGYYHDVMYGDFKLLSVGERSISLQRRGSTNVEEWDKYWFCYRTVFSEVEKFD